MTIISINWAVWVSKDSPIHQALPWARPQTRCQRPSPVSPRHSSGYPPGAVGGVFHRFPAKEWTQCPLFSIVVDSFHSFPHKNGWFLREELGFTTIQLGKMGMSFSFDLGLPPKKMWCPKMTMFMRNTDAKTCVSNLRCFNYCIYIYIIYNTIDIFIYIVGTMINHGMDWGQTQLQAWNHEPWGSPWASWPSGTCPSATTWSRVNACVPYSPHALAKTNHQLNLNGNFRILKWRYCTI